MTIKEEKSIDSIETYAYGTHEEIIHKKKENNCISIIKQYKK